MGEGPLLALGLISGTSMDGVDVALVTRDPGPEARPQLLAFHTEPYAPALAGLLLAADGAPPEQLVLLDAAVGEAFAAAALALLRDTSVPAERIACLGSHGQTIVHLPGPRALAGVPVRGTLQIGDPALIAARTGILTVADFRSMDMALGGQGAPLVPLLDWLLYRHDTRGRVLVNLGGIANVTGLPAGCPRQAVRAFDSGPGNVLLDEVARQRGVPGGVDRGGELAAVGRVHTELLERLLAHPFLQREPPKSADRAEFIRFWRGLEALVAPLATTDLLATLAEFTARSLADAVAGWLAPRQAIDEVLVAGGGLHNRAVMARLERLLAPAAVAALPSAQGITPEAKEAVAFALLALETLAGRPGNLPAVTGASREAVLGTIVPPPTPIAPGATRPGGGLRPA